MSSFSRAFKRLAHNDTSSAPGHQGGVLIPKDLQGFFPILSGTPTTLKPTVEKWLKADLYDGPKFIGQVDTRYQHQTWRAKRNPERRLTSGLGVLLHLAKKDDILLIEKDDIDSLLYRLTLHQAGSSGFKGIVAKIGNERWGFI